MDSLNSANSTKTENSNLAKMAVLASNDLTTAKKSASSWDRPEARDNYWFSSSIPNQLS